MPPLGPPRLPFLWCLGDAVWSFNYFFVEKKNLKRILLMTCREEFKSDDFMEEEGDDLMFNHLRSSDQSLPKGEFNMEMLIEDEY